MIIPFVGHALGIILELVVWVAEIYHIMTDPYGRRYGDEWAGTQVVDDKDV